MAKKLTAARRRAAGKVQKPARKTAPLILAEQLMLASFACGCGAEIEIAPHATLASEIVCVGCGEWIGVYAELLPAPARKKPLVSRTSPHRSSGRGRRSRGRGRSRY